MGHGGGERFPDSRSSRYLPLRRVLVPTRARIVVLHILKRGGRLEPAPRTDRDIGPVPPLSVSRSDRAGWGWLGAGRGQSGRHQSERATAHSTGGAAAAATSPQSDCGAGRPARGHLGRLGPDCGRATWRPARAGLGAGCWHTTAATGWDIGAIVRKCLGAAARLREDRGRWRAEPETRVRDRGYQ